MNKIDIRTGTWDAKCGICEWFTGESKLRALALTGKCTHKTHKPTEEYRYTDRMFPWEVCGYFKTRNVAQRRGA
jgi:hypothetical protein